MEKSEERMIGWGQLIFLMVGGTGTIILTCFATFVTKDALSNEFQLRSKYRDEQMSYIKDELKKQNDKMDRVMEKLDQLRGIR